MSKQNLIKFAVVLLLAVVAGILYWRFGEYANLKYIQQQQGVFQAYYADNKVLVLLLFFIGYVAVTALSLPGAVIMTLLAGALFGLIVGTIVVSFASSIGATSAFLVVRFVLGKSMQEKYGDKLKKINDGIEKEGAFYLFAMRLVPAFPFFLVNILMGLTRFPAFSFYWVSQSGMLVGTVVYVNVGTQLVQIETLKDILSPVLLLSFIALGLVPLTAKKLLALWYERQQLDAKRAIMRVRYIILAWLAWGVAFASPYGAIALLAIGFSPMLVKRAVGAIQGRKNGDSADQ